jgi:hypothetical protein
MIQKKEPRTSTAATAMIVEDKRDGSVDDL